MNISTLLSLKIEFRGLSTYEGWSESYHKTLNDRLITGNSRSNNFIVPNQEHRELLVGYCVMNSITAKFYKKDAPSKPRMYRLVYQ